MMPTHSFGFFEDDLPAHRRAAESVLENLCAATAITPVVALKQKIMAKLGFAGEKLDLKDLPPTSRYSNHISWLDTINPLLPKEPIEMIFMQEVRRDEQLVQTLVVSRVDVPEEIHRDYMESFFILEGHCACTIGGEIFELSPGDYLDIPLLIPHDVKLLSPQVTAILQYRYK